MGFSRSIAVLSLQCDWPPGVGFRSGPDIR